MQKANACNKLPRLCLLASIKKKIMNVIFIKIVLFLSKKNHYEET